MLFKNLLTDIPYRKPLTVSGDISLKEALNLLKESRESFLIVMGNEIPEGILTEKDIIKLLHRKISLEEKISPYISRNLLKIKEDRPIIVAINIMVEYFIKHLIVTDHKGAYKGVIIYDDIIEFLEGDLFKKEILLKDLLIEKPFYYLFPQERLEVALRLLVEKNIGAIPILNQEKKPVGILTERDIIYLSGTKDLSIPLKDIAIKKLYTLEVEEPVSSALQLFKKIGIKHIVITNESGEAIGIISQRDLLSLVRSNYSYYIEDKLKQAKDLLFILPEVVLEILDLGHEQVVFWENEKAISLLGDLKDKNLTSVFDENDWLKLYGKLRKEQTVFKEKLKTKDKRLFEVSGSYIKWQLEGEGRIHLILRDFTEHYKEVKSLEKELSNIYRIINSIEDFIMVVEPKTGSIKLYNQAIFKKLGYSEEEFLQKTIFDIVDLPKEKVVKNLELVAYKGIIIKEERFFLTKTGKKIPVETKASHLFLNDKPYVVILSRYKPLIKFDKFISNLSICKTEEEAYKILEKFLLDFVETIHIFEIDPSINKVMSQRLAGKKEYWKDCIKNSPGSCRAFVSGMPVIKEKIICPLAHVPEDLHYICFPLIFEGKVVNIITLIKTSFFSEEDINTLQNYLNIFTPYFFNLKLLKIAQEASIKDHLTGLYNRRFLQEILNKEFYFHFRKKQPFSIILLDLDDFKKINDVWGHLIGDKVLKCVSEIILNSIRASDICGRWGGEEFLIILPSTTKNEALEVAKRIKNNLEKFKLELENGKFIKITASMGIAEAPKEAGSLMDLFKLVDKRMYRAKELGKNKIVFED